MNVTHPSAITWRLAAVTALAAASLAAMADPVVLQNPGFDNDITGGWVTLPGGSGTTQRAVPIVGWTVTGLDTGGHVVTSGMFDTPYPHGTMAYIGGTRSDAGTLSQQSGTVQAGHYRLTVDVGWRNNLTFAGYTLALLADGDVMASNTNALAFAASEQGSWKPVSLDLDVPAASAWIGDVLTVRLSAVSPGSFQQVNFDNVALDFTAAAATAVPEPTGLALALLAVAGAATATAARRRPLPAG